MARRLLPSWLRPIAEPSGEPTARYPRYLPSDRGQPPSVRFPQRWSYPWHPSSLNAGWQRNPSSSRLRLDCWVLSCGPSASLLVSVETFRCVASADALRAYRRPWPDCRWQVASFLSRPPLALMAFALALDIVASNSTSRPIRSPHFRSPPLLGPALSVAPCDNPPWQKPPSSRHLRLNFCAPQAAVPDTAPWRSLASR